MHIPYVTAKYCDLGYNKIPYYSPNHIHTYWELVYYEEGVGTSTVDGIAFDYMPHTYVIIPPNVVHSERAGTTSRLYVYSFEIDEDFSLPNMLFFDKDGAILSEIEAIMDEYADERPFMQQKMSNHFQNLLIDTMRMCVKSVSHIDEKLEMLINYIDNYATKNIDFKNLANSMSYSYDYLRHYFKQKKGVSLKQYAQNKRLEAVKKMLRTEMPIGEIASVCGFYSTAHLSNTFCAQTGSTPSEYRKRFSENFKTCATIPLPDDMPACFNSDDDG